MAATALAAWLLLSQYNDLRVNLTYGTLAAGPGEIFHAGREDGFSAGQSTSFPVANDGVQRKYRVDLRTWRPITRLRLDLAVAPGPIDLQSFEVRGKVLGLKTARRQVPLVPVATHHAADIVPHGKGLRFSSTGDDPWLEFELPSATLAALGWEMTWLRLLAALALGLCATSFYLVTRWIVSRGALRDALGSCLRVLAPLARASSDKGGITFTPVTVAVIVLALGMAASGVAARLNFSSVGMWNSYLPSPSAADSTLLGQPRAIRSDEWLVATPWMLSQAANGYPVENPAVGGQRSTLLTSMPAKHPISALQPEFWGFALFDVERAISWHWMYKLFGLFGSSFLLLLLLTRGDGFNSALGATWLCFSSYTQWWFSTNLPELLTGMCLAVLGFLYVCKAQRRAMRVTGAVLVLLGTASFAFQLYPPFQVPLAYTALALVVGVFASRESRQQFREAAVERVTLLVACMAIISSILYIFATDAQDTIASVVSTVYPGQRFSVGGTVPWWMTFDGIFEAWRVGEDTFPWAASNASESSDFVLVFPLALAAGVIIDRRLLRDPLMLALGTLCAFLAAWMTVPMPEEVANALSRVTLLSFVPPTRVPVALGVASIFLVTVGVARMRLLSNGRATVVKIAFVAVSAFAVYRYGRALQGVDPTFFVGGRILLGCIVTFFIAWALAQGSRAAFAAAVLLVTVPGLLVNPVSRGMGPLLEKPVLAAAAAVDGELATKPKWLVMGNFLIPQAFKAVGLNVFGGTSYVPDVASLEILDPARRYAHIWNRYAHIEVVSSAGIPEPAFTLVQPDLYRLQVDVCSARLDALGIERVAYAGSAPEPDLACLKPIGAEIDGVSLYVRTKTR